MSDDVKLDRLVDMMESMMISVDKSFTQLSGEVSQLRGEVGELKGEVDEIKRRVISIEVKIENTLEPKIDLALELITKTSNYALEKRVTELERRLA